MSQSRYFSAFIISSVTFALLYIGFLTLAKTEKKLKPTPSKVIKIALIQPIKKILKPPVTPIIKATPTPIQVPIVPLPLIKKVEKKKLKKTVIIKKPKPKKIVKKKIIKKKKIVKKKIFKKKKVVKKKVLKKKKIVKQPVVEEYIPIIASPVYSEPKVIKKPKIIKTTPKVIAKTTHTQKNNHHKKAFLRNVRSKIIANKTYPKIAKRRHIEGSVKVRFDIAKEGQVSNIRFINGKRIFQKSIKKTLERTFPMSIPANVKGELPIMDVSVVLHFNIR